MNANLVRGLAVAITILLGGGVVAAITIEQSASPVTAIGGGEEPTEEETIRFIVQACTEYVAGEVDLIIDFGTVQASTVRRGDPYYNVVIDTYRAWVGDKVRVGPNNALGLAADRIQAWCAANAVTGN